MLTIFNSNGTGSRTCDGVSRRNFLKVGALGGALSLADLVRADAKNGRSSNPKSVIMIYLVGGPPHQDMFDLKPDAPAEIAGPWKPIHSNVPGAEVCELLPMMSTRMDKFTVIRSLNDAQSGHDAIQCYTGRTHAAPLPAGGWPQFGSIVNKIQGQANPGTPGFVSLCYTCTHGPYNEPGPGFLGAPFTGFRPLGDTRRDMTLKGITTDRLGNREELLTSLDRFRREADSSKQMEGLDTFTQQAMGILTSSKLADALDLSNESKETRERYGEGNPRIMIDANGAPRVPQSFLAARRLIEAGARVVTVNYSKWDWHGGMNTEGRADNRIFTREKEDFPIFDKAITALIDDLHERGLDKDTAVLVWGEFGRTPKISAKVGRDHWPRVACALMAGGGMRHGQVIGATDSQAAEPADRPVAFQEVFSTLYHHLGIDPRTATIDDLHGRPQYLVDQGRLPITELV